MTIRVAVIGMGEIGDRHARIYKAEPLAELVAVCDRVKTRADDAGQRLGVASFYDVDQMLHAVNPDLCKHSN